MTGSAQGRIDTGVVYLIVTRKSETVVSGNFTISRAPVKVNSLCLVRRFNGCAYGGVRCEILDILSYILRMLITDTEFLREFEKR